MRLKIKMKKYLLLGGTGPIGLHLKYELLKNEENEIYITSRKEHPQEDGVHYILGDAHNTSFLFPLINSFEGEITAIIDFMVWKNDDFKNVLQTFLPNCKQYIYLSSSRIYASSEEKINESSSRLLDTSNDKLFLNTDNYAIPKAQQENMLLQSGYDNFTIIRPYITYAENRLPLGAIEKEIWLYRVLKGRKIVMPKDISNCYTSLTYGRDCAAAISKIVINGLFKGEAINISTNESLKWDRVLEIYKEILEDKLNREIKIKYIDKSIKAKLGDYQAKYDRLTNRSFDLAKLDTILNTNDFIRLKDGLTLAINEFFDKNLAFNPKLQDWTIQAEMDKVTHEFASYKEFNRKKDFIKYLIKRLLPISNIRRIINNVYNTRKCKNCN